MNDPQIRLIDLNEYDLVVTVRPDGYIEISSDSTCPTDRAAALRRLADIVEANGHPCCGTALSVPWPGDARPPLPRREPSLPHPSLASPLPASPVWTDRYGRAFDLAAGWRDANGTEWWWAGIYDGGVPVMRDAETLAVYPLDALVVTYGPLTSTKGQAW